MKNIKKIVAASMTMMSLLLINPITANAAWRQNSVGWWYTEGNSYATGWKNIDGNWYYFYSDGYMAHDTIIDGYYLNSAGAWTNDIPSLSSSDAEAKIKTYLISNGYYVPEYVVCDHEEGNSYVIHCYDIVNNDGFVHTATSGWYYVNKTSGSISSMF